MARHKALGAGLLLFGLFALTALVGRALAPYGPTVQNYAVRLEPPSGAHPFGTDEHGRDVLSRVLVGARVTFLISALAVLASTLVGVTLGLTAGYAGGAYGSLVGRLTDAVAAFPGLLLAIGLMAVMGPGEASATAAIAVVTSPIAVRVARAAMVAERGREYVLAARVLGARWPRTILRTILPNAVDPLVVLVTLGLAQGVLNEAALSFLGLGAQPPAPAWGAMLAAGRNYIRDAPWYMFFPGAAIFLVIFSLNLLGDRLLDLLDPRRAT